MSSSLKHMRNSYGILAEQIFLIIMKYNESFFFSFVVSAVGVLRKLYISQGQKQIHFYSFTDGLLF